MGASASLKQVTCEDDAPTQRKIANSLEETGCSHALLVQLSWCCDVVESGERSPTTTTTTTTKKNRRLSCVVVVIEAADECMLSRSVLRWEGGDWGRWRRLEYSPAWTESSRLRIECLVQGESRVVRVPTKDVLASAEPTVASVPGDQLVERPGDQLGSVRIRAREVDWAAFAAPRYVFAIRHAESSWNRAVAHGDLVSMLSQIDHGLSDKGVRQAVGLSRAIGRRRQEETTTTTTTTHEDDLERVFLSTSIVFSSPLKRAVQTALLALRGLPAVRTVRLAPLAREVRGAYGRDNVARARGPEIPDKARQGLAVSSTSSSQQVDSGGGVDSELSRDGSSSSASGSSASDSSSRASRFSSPSAWRRKKRPRIEEADLTLAVDATEAEGDWWSVSAEDETDVAQRASDFFDFLRFELAEASACIVVTHSNFLRHLVKAHCPVAAKDDAWARHKVANCSVLALTLDLGHRTAGEEIVSADFLFGSGFATHVAAHPHSPN